MGRIQLMPVLRSKRVVVVQTEHYIIYLEPYLNRLWAHADVIRWSPKIKKDFQFRWGRLVDRLGRTVYAVNNSSTPRKLDKFLKLAGFQLWEAQDFSGQRYDVYRRHPYGWVY